MIDVVLGVYSDGLTIQQFPAAIAETKGLMLS